MRTEGDRLVAEKSGKTSKQEKDAAAVEAHLAEWPAKHRKVGERLHETILEADPELQPKLFYGAPGYTKGGPVLIFFRLDGDDLSFGFSEKANTAPPDGNADHLVASAWFVKGMDDATADHVAEIVRQATR